MKIPQCYLSMTLRIGQRKLSGCSYLFISVIVKHAKELPYKELHLCCSCTEKCHLAENAYQNKTNIKLCYVGTIF